MARVRAVGLVNLILPTHFVTRAVGFVILRHLSWLASQVYTLKHDIINVQCLMPGLLLAIRKVVRLKVQYIDLLFFLNVQMSNR